MTHDRHRALDVRAGGDDVPAERGRAHGVVALVVAGAVVFEHARRASEERLALLRELREVRVERRRAHERVRVGGAGEGDRRVVPDVVVQPAGLCDFPSQVRRARSGAATAGHWPSCRTECTQTYAGLQWGVRVTPTLCAFGP